MKISVYVVINPESRTSPSQYHRTYISSKLGGGVYFCNSLSRYISIIFIDIEKQRSLVDVKFEDLQI